jgi:archaellum component FlaC
MVKKNITINDLAIMVQKGFSDIESRMATKAEMNKKFEAMDKQFEVIDRRFGAMDKKFDRIDNRFDFVDKKFEAMDKRFETMDKKFDRIDNRFDFVDKKLARIESVLVTDHRQRIEKLEMAVFNLQNQLEIKRGRQVV